MTLAVIIYKHCMYQFKEKVKAYHGYFYPYYNRWSACDLLLEGHKIIKVAKALEAFRTTPALRLRVLCYLRCLPVIPAQWNKGRCEKRDFRVEQDTAYLSSLKLYVLEGSLSWHLGSNWNSSPKYSVNV